jgi:hypothetical protein
VLFHSNLQNPNHPETLCTAGEFVLSFFEQSEILNALFITKLRTFQERTSNMNSLLKKIGVLCFAFGTISAYAAQEGKRPESPIEIGPRFEIIAVGCLCNNRKAVIVCKKCNEPAFCSKVCQKALNNQHKDHCPGYLKLAAKRNKKRADKY